MDDSCLSWSRSTALYAKDVQGIIDDNIGVNPLIIVRLNRRLKIVDTTTNVGVVEGMYLRILPMIRSISVDPLRPDELTFEYSNIDEINDIESLVRHYINSDLISDDTRRIIINRGIYER
jgi:hypothetical protein